MKILHITPSYKPAFIYGGTTVSVSKLCESLAAIGNEVTVITTTANGKTELPEKSTKPVDIDGVKVYYFNRLTKDHTHFSPDLLRYLWKNMRNYEIIHIHSWWNLVAVFAVLLCWLRGVKPILAPRGMLSSYSFEHENSLKKKFIHKTIGHFLLTKTVLHATATAELKEGQELIKGWQGFVLPNILPLPTKILEVSAKKGSNKLNFLFLSRIDHKKGIEFMFEALADLTKKLQNNNNKFNYEFVIVGSYENDYLQELQNLATKLQISQNIVWTGRIEGNQRFQYYADADVFVLLSHNENFANVVIEALSQGTPVFISDKVGLADYVEKENFGEITSLNSIEITEKLLKLINNQGKREIIRKIAPQKIQKDFDTIILAQEYVIMYGKIVMTKNI